MQTVLIIKTFIFSFVNNYFDRNLDINHIIKITITTTATIPVTAPALKIPVITSQLLNIVTSKIKKGRMIFFIGLNFNYPFNNCAFFTHTIKLDHKCLLL